MILSVGMIAGPAAEEVSDEMCGRLGGWMQRTDDSREKDEGS